MLTGRWVAFTIASIVACGVLLALAQWQWSSAQANRHPVTQSLRDIDTVVLLTGAVPPDAVGAPVRVTGTYDASRQLRLVGQQVGNAAVDYVVTPIVEAGGVLVPIVRGYLPAGAPLPAPPAGTVTVIGALQASQYFSGTGPTISAVSTDNLVQRWNTRLRDGYVVLRTSNPAQTGLTPLPKGAVHVHHGLPVWRNITYAVQWLIFAAFVVFFWFRASRDQIRGTAGAASEQEAVQQAQQEAEQAAEPATGPAVSPTTLEDTTKELS